jgi:hypothetical protein
MKTILYFTLLIAISVTCTQKEHKEIQLMKEKTAQFTPTLLKYDESILDKRQKKVVEKLYQASKIIDKIFLDQVSDENKILSEKLAKDKSAKGRAAYDYFRIMFGRYDRLDHNAPFYGDTSKHKPAGANFYPADITKDEFLKWIKEHPEDEKAFTLEFTMIRREGAKLTAIPYTKYYEKELSEIITLMNEAAEYADNPSLKKYLLSRAKAFKTNDYFESDMDWMDLKDHAIEIIIGPYEVYEDELFNYKAAFESFLTIKDPVESKKLAVFANYLIDLEKRLPIKDEYKNFNRGSESPIMVVQEIFSAGDTKAGVQTLAFNLPNDERVREAKGSKKVMIKNMHEAKYEKLLKPIAETILEQDQLPFVTFDGFFNHTLMHEMSHGIGPGNLNLNGRKTDVKKELKETYSTIEECKADVLGMYNNLFMIEKGVYKKEFEKEMWITFLAGTFRSVRFGIGEAHGAGNAIIYNYLLEKGAYLFNEKTQKVRVDLTKIKPLVKELASILLTLQTEGNYQGAKDLIKKYAVETPSMAILREKLKVLPVDIKPVFQIEQNK